MYSNVSVPWQEEGSTAKLDRVGPVDNKPSTEKLHHFVWEKCDTWHVTCDTWHVTCDMWGMTHDMWNVTHGGGWTFSQYFTSLALTVWEKECFDDWEEKNESIGQWMSDGGVCRTARLHMAFIKQNSHSYSHSHIQRKRHILSHSKKQN